MTETFISYRRSDTRADAGRLHDRLAAHFGDELVFMDVDDIAPGDDFVGVLQSTLDRCAVLLVLIGPRWLLAENGEARRLDDPRDFVRIEIERALARGIRVIPVLVGGASMPAANDLPVSLEPLTRQQAFEIRHARFHDDVNRLIELIDGGSRRRFAPWRWAKSHRVTSAGVLVMLAVALWLGVWQPVQERRARDSAITHHRQVAQRLANDGRLPLAIEEVSKAVALDTGNVASQRQLVELSVEQLLREAFASGGPALHIGLPSGYDRQRPVSDDAIDNVLALLYRLFALDPELEDDVDLLLAHASILKCSGARIAQAIEVLERAHQRAPERADVLAELGLLRSVVLADDAGFKLLRQAASRAPESARVQFYLASGFDARGRCRRADAVLDGVRCAEALRAYRSSMSLAHDDTLWSRHIRRAASYESGIILSKVARGPDDILNPELSMEPAERLATIELMLEHGAHRRVGGWTDDPRFWLARLHEATGERLRAREIMTRLIAERGGDSPAWQALLERVSKGSR